MRTITCYNCGGEVIPQPDGKMGICSCCTAEIPLPEQEATPAELYAEANTLLSKSEFDEAKDKYQQILLTDPFEAAACWGMAISEYGVEYVQDPMNGELLPTLHRLADQKFSEYLYTKKAIENATDRISQTFFRAQSQLIDRIQSHSLQISRKEDPYDVFICYKKSDEGEERTADSRMARDIYKKLTQRGYKVFFAEETLTVGDEFEPRIFAALSSARVMIAVGSRLEYYNAIWVRNEWSRYADLIRKEAGEGKHTRHLIPMFQNIPEEQLPAQLREQPVKVNVSTVRNPLTQILDRIAEVFSSGDGNADVSSVLRQLRTSEAMPVTAGITEESAENYVQRGNLALLDEDYSKAAEMFRKSLKLGTLSDAYLGLFMCKEKLPTLEALDRFSGYPAKNSDFCKAVELASPQRQAMLRQLSDAAAARSDAANLVIEKRKEAWDFAEQQAEDFYLTYVDSDLGNEIFRADRQTSAMNGSITEYKAKNAVRRIARFFLLFDVLIPGILVTPMVLLDMGKIPDANYIVPMMATGVITHFVSSIICAIWIYYHDDNEEFWPRCFISLLLSFINFWIMIFANYLLLLWIPIYWLFYGHPAAVLKRKAPRKKLDKQSLLDQLQQAYEAAEKEMLARLHTYDPYFTDETEKKELYSQAAAALKKKTEDLKKQIERVLSWPRA